MKVVVDHNRIILSGKKKEITAILKKLSEKYVYVHEMIAALHRHLK